MKKCVYCSSVENVGIDHMIPRSRGGLDIPENVVPSCKKCNSSKNNRTPSEWRKDLPARVYDLEKRALALHPVIKAIRNRNKKVHKSEQVKSLLDAVAAKQGLGLSTWILQAANVVARAETVIYLGHNFDGTACGTPELFETLSVRAVLAHVPHPKNTLIVYGSEKVKRVPLREEAAGIDWRRTYSFAGVR